MQDPHMPPNDDNNDAQKQLDAQLQGQAELQGQLQGQGQGQGEHQSQTQSSDNSNINGNLNCDSNSNDNANCNVNANYNTSDTNVTVDGSVADQTALCSQPSAIDMSNLSIEMPDNQGIVNLMPSNVYQTIDGTGDNANNVTPGEQPRHQRLCLGYHQRRPRLDQWPDRRRHSRHRQQRLVMGCDVGSGNGQGDSFSQTLTSGGAVDALTHSIVLGSNTS
jgi:hypothetical protein